MPGSRWSPNFGGRLCQFPAGPVYLYTLRVGDISLHGNGGIIISRELLNNSEEIHIQCLFVQHESHLKSQGIEPGSAEWEGNVYTPDLNASTSI
jgi:hypothetical protein